MKKFTLVLLTCFIFIQAAFANDMLTSNIKYALKRSTDGSYFSVVIALGIVILLIYITGIIYAKLNILGHNTMKKQYIDLKDSKLLILSTTPIGANKSLLVVELAGKKMLIGVTNDNITLIKDLSEEEKTKGQVSKVSENVGKGLPLDKIYPQENNDYEIEFKDNIPEENEDNTKYDAEEFGLYKKYLDD